MSKIFRCKTENGYQYSPLQLNRLDLNIEEYQSVEDIFDMFKMFYIGEKDNGHGLSHILSVYNRSLDIWKQEIDMGVVGETMSEARDRQQIERKARMFMLAAVTHDLFSESHRETHHIEAYQFVKAIRSLALSVGVIVDRITIDIIDVNVAIADATNNTALESIQRWVIRELSKPTKEVNEFIEDLTTVMYMVLRHRSSIPFNSPVPCTLGDDFSLPYLPDDDMVRAFRAGDKDEPDLDIILKRMVDVTVHDKKSKYKLPIPQSFRDEHKNTFIGKELLSVDDLLKIKFHLIDKFGKDGYAYRDMDISDPYYTYHSKSLNNLFNAVEHIKKYNNIPYVNYSNLTHPLELILEELAKHKLLEEYLNNQYSYYKVLITNIGRFFNCKYQEEDIDTNLLNITDLKTNTSLNTHVLRTIRSEDKEVPSNTVILFIDKRNFSVGQMVDLLRTVMYSKEVNTSLIVTGNENIILDFSISPKSFEI